MPSKFRAFTVFHILFISSLLIISEIGYVQRVNAFGINYGQVANNLPSPDKVVTLMTSLKITKTRIYDTNPQVLAAFANSGVELIVTVPNDLVGQLVNPAVALDWLNTNVKPYMPETNITEIAVGNEVFTGDDLVLMSNLVPAMIGLYEALMQLNLHTYIHISTANSLAVLSSSYPPSAGIFRDDLAGVLLPLLQFLEATGSPLWINAYPYFAYKDDPEKIPLDYVLFNANPGMFDPYTNLHYDNMLYAQVDAVVFAMVKMGFGGIEVRVSETGWPSKGDSDEIGATLENAAVYNRNLVRRQEMGEGTPLKPNQRLEIYVFALFNEDMKPGPTSERNYGLYLPDGSMAYNVGLTGMSTSAASVSLTSSSTQDAKKDFRRMGFYLIFLYLLTFQALVEGC